MTDTLWSHKQATYALVSALVVLTLADASVQWFQTSGIATTVVGEFVGAPRLLRAGLSLRRAVLRLYLVWLVVCVVLLARWHHGVRRVLSSRKE